MYYLKKTLFKHFKGGEESGICPPDSSPPPQSFYAGYVETLQRYHDPVRRANIPGLERLQPACRCENKPALNAVSGFNPRNIRRRIPLFRRLSIPPGAVSAARHARGISAIR